MTWLLIFNVVMLLLLTAVLLERIPRRFYSDLVRGLHFSIGITTPTDRQLRWTFATWLISILVIVDGMALLLKFVEWQVA